MVVPIGFASAPSNISTVEDCSAVPYIVGVLSFVVEPVTGDVIVGFRGITVSIVTITAVEAGLLL